MPKLSSQSEIDSYNQAKRKRGFIPLNINPRGLFPIDNTRSNAFSVQFKTLMQIKLEDTCLFATEHAKLGSKAIFKAHQKNMAPTVAEISRLEKELRHLLKNHESQDKYRPTCDYIENLDRRRERLDDLKEWYNTAATVALYQQSKHERGEHTNVELLKAVKLMGYGQDTFGPMQQIRGLAVFEQTDFKKLVMLQYNLALIKSELSRMQLELSDLSPDKFQQYQLDQKQAMTLVNQAIGNLDKMLLKIENKFNLKSRHFKDFNRELSRTRRALGIYSMPIAYHQAPTGNGLNGLSGLNMAYSAPMLGCLQPALSGSPPSAKINTPALLAFRSPQLPKPDFRFNNTQATRASSGAACSTSKLTFAV